MLPIYYKLVKHVYVVRYVSVVTENEVCLIFMFQNYRLFELTGDI